MARAPVMARANEVLSFLIPAATLFAMGAALTGSVAGACSCGPTGTSGGLLTFELSDVLVNGEDMQGDWKGWPEVLVGELPTSERPTGRFVLSDPETGELVVSVRVVSDRVQ